MIRCVVIDDEPYARELLKNFISKVPDASLEGSFASALHAIPILSKENIDVIFLDIQMPDISGIDFIKSLDQRPTIIFTTAYAEYAIEGFALDVADYLLKPFDFQRFLKAINKVRKKSVALPERESSAAEDFIFVKDGTKLVKVQYSQILFLKGTREYVTLHTSTQKIMTLQTMKSFENNLPDYFVRVHNSFIINLRTIDSIEKDEIQIADELIPVGQTYKKAFHEKIQRFFPGTK
jgi:two-component system, LytTR family, response regulator